MKKFFVIAVASIMLIGACAQSQMQAPVQSLRGAVAIPAGQQAPQLAKVIVEEGAKWGRSFKEQPPLVPHSVQKYNVSLRMNKCLKCHDKDTYKDEKAPMIGKSHYMAADGREMNKIHMSRYFCSQCHVSQTNTIPLVENTFASVK